LAFPKRSLPIAARNLLQTFGLNCARCFTSPTNKQLLTTLSPTEQSKGCTAASRTPFAHAPPRQLGPRSYFLCSSDSEHSRGKTMVFPRLRQFFGAPIVLPSEFLQNEEMSVDAIIKIFSKTLHVPAVSLPRHNSSAQLPSELPGNLLSAPLVWVCRGGVIPPLQPNYDGPYAVLRSGPRSFTIRAESWDEVIAVSCLKACTASDAMPSSPRCRSRPPGSQPGGPAATKRVSFPDPLDSSPSPPAPPRDGPGTVFLPSEEVFARQGPAPSQVPQTRCPSRQRAPPQRLDL
jgi:hypothetical protein